MLPDRDAAAVVGDGAAVVRMEHDLDLRGVPRQRLVYRVVDDLVDEVVKAARPGRADVHARTLADGLEPFEDRDVLGAVAVACLRLLRRAPRLRLAARHCVLPFSQRKPQSPVCSRAGRHSGSGPIAQVDNKDTRVSPRNRWQKPQKLLQMSRKAKRERGIPGQSPTERRMVTGWLANQGRSARFWPPDLEPQRRRRQLPQALAQTGPEVVLEEVELLCPDRVAAGDDHGT